MSRGTRRIESDYVRDDRRSRVSEDVIVDGRVYLGSTTAKNFSYREINDWMYEYGKVLDVVFFDRHILVQFDRDSEARKAIEREKGKSFKGTRFDIRPAYSSDGSMSRSETHHSKSPRDSNFERGARDISPGFRERDRSPLDKDRYIKESSQDFRVNDRRRLLSKDNIRPNIRPDLSDELAVVPVRNPSQSLPNPKNVPSEKPSFDAAIVVMSGNLLNYAEIIETKLQRLVALTTHIIVLKEEAHANACIDDLEKKGVLYAFLVNQMNEKHASCTLRILYGLGQEHRNMPLASALSYVARNFEDYQKQNLEPKSAAPKTTFDPSRIPPAFLPPDDKIIYELHLLADSRMLTLEELNEVDDFIQKRIQMLDEAEGQLANKSNSMGIEGPQKMSSKGMMPPYQSLIPTQQGQLHPKQMNPSVGLLDSELHQYQQYSDPVSHLSPNQKVQQALDTLLQSKFRAGSIDQMGQQPQASLYGNMAAGRNQPQMNPGGPPLTPGLLNPVNNYGAFFQQQQPAAQTQQQYRARPPFQGRPPYQGY